MVVHILDIVNGADTALQEADAFARLHDALANKDARVVVSFDGVQNATSSFVRFVQLLSAFSLEDIEARLRVVHSTRQINDMIRSRLEREDAASSVAA